MRINFLKVTKETPMGTLPKLNAHKSSYVMRCVIWYRLYNLKNVKNSHGGVLLLVKLQA